MLSLHLAAAISLAGLGLSLYLTVAPSPQFCEVTSFVSCDRVLSSPYAKFLGVPTAMYGAVWFAVASSIAFLAVERNAFSKLLVAWSAVGLAGVASLVYVELFLIN
ncbi:MAG: vitamin K epoxide reductase family protein, partial [Candidatus Caldarchaeum sp.]|nr:vitamin K epoxide reductase family protein [Candidatus Caldarchaeum sp.]